MTEVVSVKFKNRGKIYYFDPVGIAIPNDTDVIVETAKGLELAHCCYGNHYVNDSSLVQPLRPIVRIATESDFRVAENNKKREKEAFEICQQKIAEHGLDMKLVDVECNFEGTKTMFFFISDGRVDFRELVKDLASVFRNRIELRQIGVRDEAKMLGGIGICGRNFCCNQFLDEFQPVSTKMAKLQSMSLNPTKISGNCGRLMCCLRYEEEAYEALMKTAPKNGAFVETPTGYGTVTQVSLLRQTVKVRLDGEGDDIIKSYKVDNIAVIPGGRPKPGEPLPSLLKDRPAPEPEQADEPEQDFWQAPSLFAEDMHNPAPAEAPAKKKDTRRRGRGNRKPGAQSGGAQTHSKPEGAAQSKEPQRQGQGQGAKQNKKPSGHQPPKEQKPSASPEKSAEGSQPQKRRNRYSRGRRGGGQRPEGQNGTPSSGS